MDLQQRLAALATPFQKLGPVEWLTLSTSAGFVVLLALLVVQSRQHSRLKREMAETKPERHPRGEDSVHPHGVLDGTTMSPIDRVFPRRPGPFLMMIATVALGCWLAGYLLAPDVGRFLRSPEWLFQPFYIVAHLVTLRLFINVFTRNYAAGVTHLDVSRTQALRGVRTMLGPIGSLAAALIALPFAVLDFRYLFSNRYTPMGGDGVVRSIDYLMWSIWSVEWFINAFIWVLLLGFLVKNSLTIATHPFRAPIHVVLQDKLYRPFLQMSAQGSTVVLGFSLVTVAYLYYTGGELTDYTGTRDNGGAARHRVRAAVAGAARQGRPGRGVGDDRAEAGGGAGRQRRGVGSNRGA